MPSKKQTVKKQENLFIINYMENIIYKDEDFEGAEVTEEPDPTLEDSREIEEEISAGKQLQLLLL